MTKITQNYTINITQNCILLSIQEKTNFYEIKLYCRSSGQPSMTIQASESQPTRYIYLTGTISSSYVNFNSGQNTVAYINDNDQTDNDYNRMWLSKTFVEFQWLTN